jgi:hypothetical protein
MERLMTAEELAEYPAETDLPSYRAVIAAAVGERQKWRAQYEAAKQRAGWSGRSFGNGHSTRHPDSAERG